MVQQELPTISKSAPGTEVQRAVESLRLWGLTPRQLHDAYWRSKGVQCVRRGHKQRLQRGAELFLLLEPDQLVLFNIAQLSERLTWHNARVTRLRLVDEVTQRYSEHVVTDNRGLVQCVERRYKARVQGSSRVMLTSSRRIAGTWMTALSRHDGWDRVRRSVSWSRVDHLKCAGITFAAGDSRQQQQLIVELMQRWANPDQAISGLEEIEPGVWHVAGESVVGGVVRVGPLWLGRGGGGEDRRCIVGPAWTEDWSRKDSTVATESGRATVKDIADVELSDESLWSDNRSSPRFYPFVKRAFDMAASLTALLVLFPIMIVIGACVWFETGWPLFFGHKRQGRGGRMFRCWKFRTMRRDAEKIARELGMLNKADGPQVLIPNDPRVTRVGRVLRATNLDELPQFWNVLAGQMSLVGPRPSPDDENQFCPAWRDVRLSVRPGITGLWQLKRTREPGEDFQEWIKYDIQYVQQATFWFDMVILAKTARMMMAKGRTFSAFE